MEVLADGNIKDVLGQPSAKATASGSLGLQYIGSRNAVTGLVNILGTDDTVRTGHAASLLIPAAGTGLNAAALTIRSRLRDWTSPRCSDFATPIDCNVGFRLHADASTKRWATRIERTAPPAGTTDSTERIAEIREVPSWGLGLGAWYAFFDGAIEATDGASRPVLLMVDVGVAHRALRGDLAGGRQEDTRKRLLGTGRRNYTGAEIGLVLIFDRIRSGFTYYWFNGNADGLSGGQIVASVELRAPLASGLLSRK